MTYCNISFAIDAATKVNVESLTAPRAWIGVGDGNAELAVFGTTAELRRVLCEALDQVDAITATRDEWVNQLPEVEA